MTQRLSLRGNWASAIILLGLAQPALGMDCQKAESAIDKAICGDPAAAAADEAMSAAYSALFAVDSDSAKKQLLQSQRAWLKLRGSSCGEDKKPSVKCLIDWTQRRTLYLQGKPETGPGTGHELVPVIIVKAAAPKVYELDITASKFIAPVLLGEKHFNTEIEKLLADAPSKKETDDQRDMTYTYDLHLRVTYASPRFLSASMETYQFSGGAHGNSGTSGINIDIAKGTDLTFADAFEPTAFPKLEDLCLTQIRAQKAEKMPDYDQSPAGLKDLRGTIGDTLSKFDRWFFSATQATVTFDPYELGAYVEGSYECTFPVDVLHPLYKAHGILP